MNSLNVKYFGGEDLFEIWLIKANIDLIINEILFSQELSTHGINELPKKI